MIDSVIAGTGNSRYLRTSISASTTWADALTMLRAGTFPIDLAGINISGFTTLGTALNADTLLKSAVITALGLSENATPSDAWEAVLALIDAKADADSVVTGLTYDGATKTLSATINGASVTVATFNFTTPQEAAELAPVQSVAGKTGIVALNAGDVAYSEGTSYSANTIGKALEDDDARMGEIEGDISEIQGDISDIQGDITEIKGDVSDIQGDITDIQGDITDIGEDITGINNELDAFESDVEENYARVDGYYEEMTVGNAEQLVATVGVNDNSPYLFRTTGGSADVGDRKTMELVGGTVAWNQLARRTESQTSETKDGITYTKNDDGSWTIRGLAEATTIKQLAANIGLGTGHKCLIWYGGVTFDSVSFRIGDFNNGTSIVNNAYGAIYNRSGTSVVFDIQIYSGKSVDMTIFPMYFDLTQMFGSTIADYIYSLEQAHVGDGVAWFRKYFPKSYYDYDAGTLMSVKTSANVTTGFNQWDEEWEVGAYNSITGAKASASGRIRSKNYIPVVPNMKYYFQRGGWGSFTAYLYDANKAYIGQQSLVENAVQIPDNCYYMTFNTGANSGETYTGGICINLSWDGERDGEYEPYDAHTYPLDSDLELRGIPKLDADSALYYDGDTYASDGTVQRKYGIVDLGTLTWTYRGTSAAGMFSTPLANYVKPISGTAIPHAVCIYTVASLQSMLSDTTDLIVSLGRPNSWDGFLLVKNKAYTDPATFKTAMNGVYLVYELATPTTEEADPFTSPETVDDFGTEQYVDTRAVPIPVGHNSVYQANLRAKLEMAPDSPNGDGDYLVRQSNGTNAYVPYILPTAGQIGFDESAEYDDGTVGAELNNKADVDGYYETLTSGLAENLIATVGVEDSVPYNFRTTGGSADVGDRKEMEIVGGTIAWNQLTHDTEASNTKSGDIVTIDDAKAVPFESLKVVFEPSQDLHGYDSPWPAGGGKNKYGGSALKSSLLAVTGATEGSDSNGSYVNIPASTALNDVTLFDGFSENTQYTIILKFLPTGAAVTNVRVYYTDNTYQGFSSSADGAIATVSYTTTAGKTVAAIKLGYWYTTTSKIYYDGCGVFAGADQPFSPYENICPISGYTGANLWDTAANLANVSASTLVASAITNTYLENGITVSATVAGTYKSSTFAVANLGAYRGKKLTFSCDASGTYRRVIGRFWVGNTVFSPTLFEVTNDRVERTITVPSDLPGGGVLRIGFYCTGSTSVTGEATYTNIMLNVGETAEEYVAFSGTTVPVSWQSEAGTVYDGYIDLMSGKLVKEWTSVRIVDVLSTASLNTTQPTGYTEGRVTINTGTIGANNRMKCDSFKYSSSGAYVRFAGFNTSLYFTVPGDGLTLEEWKAEITSIDPTVVYILATPVEYTLTAQQVTALLGLNNVWNDIGTTELTYKSANEHHTLMSGHKYLTRINNVDSFVAGTGQEVVAQCGRDNVFDLTQMFGNTIATYLGGITAANAVAWFRNLFPKPLYAYDGGTLQSVKTSANVTIGFNQWDEETESGRIDLTTGETVPDSSYLRSKNFCGILPNTSYYGYAGSNPGTFVMAFYDASENYVGYLATSYARNKVFTTPTDAQYFKLYVTANAYANDVCINLSWDGERDGEYEPYIARTYALDSDLELRGIPKLTADNQLYYDGDTYEADGTVTRKYKSVDLGTLNWTYLTAGSGVAPYFYANIEDIVKRTSTQIAYQISPVVCAKYVATVRNQSNFVSGCVVVDFNGSIGQIQIKDNGYSNAAAFKTAMSGVYLVYELDESTTEEADTYADFMVVNDFGTEEFVDAGVTADPPTRDVAIPVGHNTVYAANLRAKLEMAPDSPDGDGDYIVRQTNGENAYVLLEKELPAAPTANGEFTLKCTVSNGTATYSWVSVS